MTTKPQSGREASKWPRVSIYYEGRQVMRTAVRGLQRNCVHLEPGQCGLIAHMVVGIKVDTDWSSGANETEDRIPAVVLVADDERIELELECSEYAARRAFLVPVGGKHGES